jgi:hypothetical protein
LKQPNGGGRGGGGAAGGAAGGGAAGGSAGGGGDGVSIQSGAPNDGSMYRAKRA